MGGCPKVYNIEMDPQEDLNVAGLFGRIGASTLRGSIGTMSSSREANFWPMA
jgi:hypothetical protein